MKIAHTLYGTYFDIFTKFFIEKILHIPSIPHQRDFAKSETCQITVKICPDHFFDPICKKNIKHPQNSTTFFSYASETHSHFVENVCLCWFGWSIVRQITIRSYPFEGKLRHFQDFIVLAYVCVHWPFRKLIIKTIGSNTDEFEEPWHNWVMRAPITCSRFQRFVHLSNSKIHNVQLNFSKLNSSSTDGRFYFLFSLFFHRIFSCLFW